MFLFPLIALLVILTSPVYQAGYSPSQADSWLNFGFAVGLCIAPLIVNAIYMAGVERLGKRPNFDFFKLHRIWGNVYRIIIMAFFFLQVHYLGWMNIWPWVSETSKVSSTFMLVWGMLPFGTMLILAWLPLYKLSTQHLGCDWKRAEYLLFNTRQTFLIIIPLTFFFILLDLSQLLPASISLAQDGGNLANVVIFPIVLIMTPLFLKWYLGAHPMPAGPLRSRLVDICKTQQIGCRNILIWPTGGSRMINAMVTGLIAPVRYFFITDALLNSMSEPEVEAVFGHELGHIRYKHFWNYGFLALGLILLLWVLEIMVPYLSTDEVILWLFAWQPLGSQTHTVYVMLIFIVYVRLIFGSFSRMSERQADLFGAEVAGSPQIMASALQTIGILSGHAKTSSSWRHHSLERRVNFLRDVDLNPKLAEQHHSKMRLLVAGLMLSIIIIMSVLLWARFEIEQNALFYKIEGIYEPTLQKKQEYLQKAKNLDPTDVEIRKRYAEVLYRLDRIEEAEHELMMAKALETGEF